MQPTATGEPTHTIGQQTSMTTTTIARSSTREPYLLRFATPRSASAQEMPGRYCEARQLWVVDVEGESRPIIEEASDMLTQTHTKTMTQVEADDHDHERGAMAETSTYTKVRQEADDQDASLALPEIQTKTDIQQETDDQVTGVV